jgi:type III restriction enzyme
MARAKQSQSTLHPDLFQARVSTAPCVPAIRERVADWKRKDYPGVTETTRLCLRHWFHTDHRLPNGRRFRYHDAQQEAVETLVYLFEVARIRRQKALLETFTANPNLRLLQYDLFPRYCVKMATGSGKTRVMALVFAWQYFNAVAEGRDEYARTGLLIAPNVIVFERLRSDFENGRLFRVDPVIPSALAAFWDVEVYLRGETERATSLGALYVTNIQQLYDRPDGKPTEPDVLTTVLGTRPPASLTTPEDFEQRLLARGSPCLVLNDEAHHTHDEESEWNRGLRRLHETLAPAGIVQTDFTATPRHSKGTLFTWTVFDYPLKQAILDGIVKRPMKGVTEGIQEVPSDLASVRYEAYLTAAVERWREYRTQLAPLGKKPLLFVMMNSSEEADDVGDYLKRKYPVEFDGEQTLVIHTDRTGEVSKKDLERARQVAHDVDEEASPVNALVSVMMLREGWDVQNVTVVVGLRPYSSKANILPEQSIGRGLRRMFRDQAGYTERVDVIGNRRFIEFVEELEKEEGLELETFRVGKDRLRIETIAPDPDKADKDILIPSLSPLLARKKSLTEEIAALDVQALHHPVCPLKPGDEAARRFRYQGYDILTLEKELEREYVIPTVQTAQEIISYFAKRIAQDVKLPSQFAALVPRVRQFLETCVFGQAVDLEDPTVVKALTSRVVAHVTIQTLAAALRHLAVEEKEPVLLHEGRRLSETPPFPFARETMPATKTIFNRVAPDNDFERRFARFLEEALDVVAFAKLPEQFGFSIAYTDAAINLRYYEPDFVAVLSDGRHALIETKGLEDVNVAHKDQAARRWCEVATVLTGQPWHFVKVPQAGFESLQPSEYADLMVFQ